MKRPQASASAMSQAIGPGLAALGLDLGAHAGQLLRIPRDDAHAGAGLRQLQRGRAADAGRAARHQDRLARDDLVQAAALVQVRIQAAFPVVPQPPGIVLQPRHADARRRQQRLRLAGIEAGRMVEQTGNRLRHAELAQHLLDHTLHRPQRLGRRVRQLRHRVQQIGFEPQRHRRRVRGPGEQVQYLADAAVLRVREVEAAPVVPGHVRQVRQRRRDEIHRHQVDVAALETDQRHPARQVVAQLLDQLEEVVGAIDLVHGASARIADDHSGPIHAPRDTAGVADQCLRLVLGAKIRMVQPLGLAEHVFRERAPVAPSNGDRTHQMKAAGLDLVRELQRPLGAEHVGTFQVRRRCAQIVQRAEMKEMADAAAQLAAFARRYTEELLLQVPFHRHDELARIAPFAHQALDLGARARPDEHPDGFAARAKPGDEMAAYEAGGPGNEIAHVRASTGRRYPDTLRGTRVALHRGKPLGQKRPRPGAGTSND